MDKEQNYILAQKVLEQVARRGVAEIVFCAGARSAPFLQILERTSEVKVHYFFEERSASFFALGRALSTLKPVAVFTTSGTAVAELLPACIEAFYSSVPLLFVTADRPKSYRGSGAPQAIEQAGLFSSYVAKNFDLDNTSQIEELNSWGESLPESSFIKPEHWNVCFEEPQSQKMNWGETQSWSWTDLQVAQSFEPAKASQPSNFKWPFKKPLVLIGQLPVCSIVREVQQKVLGFSGPIYAEASSGLRDLCSLRVTDELAPQLIEQGEIDGIIRIGGVPTLRLWRDLESKYKSLPVINFSSFSGLARASANYSLFALPNLSEQNFSNSSRWSAAALLGLEELSKILEAHPNSEPGLIYHLSAKTLPEHKLFLGNSLPIREWNLCSQSHAKAFVNRGANGIDGQISTFLGTLQSDDVGWGVFGDLTTLYDLSSLWTLRSHPSKAQIIIVNNGGGQIFSKIFESKNFRNEHDLSFSNWSKMWDVKFEQWKEIPVKDSFETARVIELIPDKNETDSFWKEWTHAKKSFSAIGAR